MRVLLSMVRKDLTRNVRAPLGIVLTLAFPVLFSLLLALAFGGANEPKIPRVRLLVEDRDGGFAARTLLSAFGTEELAQYFEVEEVGEEGRSRMERGDASALLRIPEGFTEDLVRGNATELELVRNPSERILPEIAEQLALSLTEILSAGSRVLREPLDGIAAMIDSGAEGIADASIADVAVASRRVVDSAADLLFPPVITLSSVDLEDPEDDASGSGGVSVFLWVLPGISVFSLFMIGDVIMRDLLTESQAGTLRRQLCAPLGVGTVVLGKLLHTAVVASLGLVVLSAVGWFVARATIDVAAFVLLSMSLIVLVTGAASLVYGVARNERQGGTMASVVYLTLAFAGGSFIQTDSLPQVLQRIGPYTPFYWATDGFRRLLWDDGRTGDVLVQVGLLAGSGLVLLWLGSRLLERRMLRRAS